MRKGVLVAGILLLMIAVLLIIVLSAFNVSAEEVYLTSAMHLDVNRTEVFNLDETYYLADMKDSSKNFYLNFTDNLINNTNLSIYAKKNKGITVGVYAQIDDSGNSPFAIFTVTSTTGEWYNVTLNINESTNSIWIGEGSESGTDPKDEFDYISAFNPPSDSTPPEIVITYPENITYSFDVSELNYTISDNSDLDSCWYSTDIGITNSTPVSAGTNWTDISFIENSNTWFVYCNDSSGNLNNTESVTFFVDITSPSVSIVKPGNDDSFGAANNLALNFSADDSGIGIADCWYNLDNADNISIIGCENTSFSVAGSGSYVLELFANDSLNNLGKDSVSFSVAVGAPSISLSSPVNVFLNESNVTFVYIPSHTNLDTCELWGNFSEEFILNQTSAELVSDAENYFYLDLIDGNYTWNIRCNDSLNNIADNGNKSFIIDTVNPDLVLSEPSGTKNSRTVSASWSINDENLADCVYNVYRGLNIEIENNSVKCQDNNASFAVTVDADFIFNFYVNDSAGNTNFSSSSFSVSTSGSGGGSTGGGGGGTTPPIKEVAEELDVSGVDNVVMKPGETKTLSVNARNSGPAYLNKCELIGGGEASNWISGEGTQGLAAGQSADFVFSVDIPNNAEAKDYGASVFIRCDEDSSYQDFTISILESGLKLSIQGIEQKGKSLDFSYLVENTAGENLNIKVEYWLVGELNSKEAEASDSFGLSSGEQSEKQGNLDLTGLAAGTYTLVIKANSEKESVIVQEQIIVGSTGLTGGLAIFGEQGGRVFSIIFMIGLGLFLSFLIIRRIIKKVGKHDRTHFIRHKLRRR